MALSVTRIKPGEASSETASTVVIDNKSVSRSRHPERISSSLPLGHVRTNGGDVGFFGLFVSPFPFTGCATEWSWAVRRLEQ